MFVLFCWSVLLQILRIPAAFSFVVPCIIVFSMKTWLIITDMHTAWAVVKLKNSGLNEIRTHDLCDIGAVLYPLTLTQLGSFRPDCLRCVYNCDDQSSLHMFLRSSNIWSLLYSFTLYLEPLGCIYNMTVTCWKFFFLAISSVLRHSLAVMLTGVTWQLGIVILVLIEVVINLVLMLIEFHVIKGTGRTVLEKKKFDNEVITCRVSVLNWTINSNLTAL